MSGSIPGYPVPIQEPGINEARNDPDEENPHELVLDAADVRDPLLPLPPDELDDEDDA